VGHSWGSLIALEAAARLQGRITHAALVGCAFPMRVSAALLEAAQHEPAKAIALINQFSRSTLAPPPSALGPGTWVDGLSTALNHRVLRAERLARLEELQQPGDAALLLTNSGGDDPSASLNAR
jgi:pimeloyl-ACP methyl ester carboxylesterase